MRDVGDGHDPVGGLLLDVFELFVQSFYARRHDAKLGQKRLGILAGLLHACHFAGGLVAAGFQLFGLKEQVAPFLVDGQKRFKVQLAAAFAQPVFDLVRI